MAEMRDVMVVRHAGPWGWLKRRSISGLIFAVLFALFATACLVWALLGQWFASALVFLATLPFSLLLLFPCEWLHDLGVPYEVVNWTAFALESLFGVFEFYALGWLMERPFRR